MTNPANPANPAPLRISFGPGKKMAVNSDEPVGEHKPADGVQAETREQATPEGFHPTPTTATPRPRPTPPSVTNTWAEASRTESAVFEPTAYDHALADEIAHARYITDLAEQAEILSEAAQSAHAGHATIQSVPHLTLIHCPHTGAPTGLVNDDNLIHGPSSPSPIACASIRVITRTSLASLRESAPIGYIVALLGPAIAEAAKRAYPNDSIAEVYANRSARQQLWADLSEAYNPSVASASPPPITLPHLTSIAEAINARLADGSFTREQITALCDLLSAESLSESPTTHLLTYLPLIPLAESATRAVAAHTRHTITACRQSNPQSLIGQPSYTPNLTQWLSGWHIANAANISHNRSRDAEAVTLHAAIHHAADLASIRAASRPAGQPRKRASQSASDIRKAEARAAFADLADELGL